MQHPSQAQTEMSTAALKLRIIQLETAIEEICENVVTLRKDIVRSQVLTQYPCLSDCLQDAVNSCLHCLGHGESSQDDFALSQPCEGYPGGYFQTESQPRGAGTYKKSVPIQSAPELPFSKPSTATFINYLRIACLYYGYMILDKPSIPLEALKRPFRLLLPLVTRDNLTCFFYTRLQARLTNKLPGDSLEIPHFQIGGAGFHFPEVSAFSDQETESQKPCRDHMVPDDWSSYSPEVQEELQGEWFDLEDLERYLEAISVRISTKPQIAGGCVVNAVDFAAALIRNCICLGRSPGFKRIDVDFAIKEASGQ
ncbi:hypothetical protein BJY01DRAFT_235756 [Aspergillus pseudoustus]|uniref:Uncharacterized protein n=1 Tax=Aspergillus pseudoustus TaxID=1810923 RepID=A0ABR4JW80_9EURO